MDGSVQPIAWMSVIQASYCKVNETQTGIKTYCKEPQAFNFIKKSGESCCLYTSVMEYVFTEAKENVSVNE